MSKQSNHLNGDKTHGFFTFLSRCQLRLTTSLIIHYWSRNYDKL